MRATGFSIGIILVIGLLSITTSSPVVDVSSFNMTNVLDPYSSTSIDGFSESKDTQLIWQNLGQIGNVETDFYCEFESSFVCFNMGQIGIWTANDQSPILLDFTRLRQTYPIGINEAVPVSHFFLGDRGTFTGVKSYHAVEYRDIELECGIRFIPMSLGFRIEVTSDASLQELVSVSNPTALDIQFKSYHCDDKVTIDSNIDFDLSQLREYELTVVSLHDSDNLHSLSVSDYIPSQSEVYYTYSTYLGGSSYEYSYGIDVDSADNVYVCGRTGSTDFPILNGYDPSYNGNGDYFITKLSENGELLYSTYIGGSSFEGGGSIAVDTSGCAYVTGYTESSDFPTVNAYDSTYNGDSDTFVCKLSSSGNQLLYSTFYGGSRDEYPYSIAVRPDGGAIVVGYSWGTPPTVNSGILEDHTGDDPGFVIRLSPGGDNLIFAGLLGGDGDTQCAGVEVDDEGYIYIASRTYATTFPVGNAYDYTNNGRSDSTVTKLHPNASWFEYSTYVGGSEEESVTGIDIDSEGNVYVCGRTYSADFPMVNAFDTVYGWGDIFVYCLNASGDYLKFSTFLSDDVLNHNEFPFGIVANDYGHVYVVSVTEAADFPMVHPIDDTINGEDIVVAKIDTNQGRIVYSTFIGGTGNEVDAGGVVIDSMDNAIVCSGTPSLDFPTVNAYDSSLSGSADVTVTKIPPLGDSDGDTLFDIDENINGTDPYNIDSDYDLMDDAYEVLYGLNPLLNDSMDDLDNDTLTNLEEFNLGTNPGSPDSDDDTLGDAREVNELGTDPLSSDSDSDGYLDPYEVEHGFDPLNPYDPPNTTGQPGPPVQPLPLTDYIAVGVVGGIILVAVLVVWRVILPRRNRGGASF